MKGRSSRGNFAIVSVQPEKIRRAAAPPGASDPRVRTHRTEEVHWLLRGWSGVTAAISRIYHGKLWQYRYVPVVCFTDLLLLYHTWDVIRYTEEQRWQCGSSCVILVYYFL